MQTDVRPESMQRINTPELAQEFIDKKVKEILKELDLEDKSDFHKIKAVHDYLCDNVAEIFVGLVDGVLVKSGCAGS